MSGQVRVHAACGAASPRFAAGFAGSFHQLPQAVAPDPWVRTFVRACVGAAAALAALGLYAALRFSCRLASPRDARPTRLRLLFAAAPIGGAALSARLALLTPWLADRSAYAVCEGVEGGDKPANMVSVMRAPAKAVARRKKARSCASCTPATSWG